MASKYWIKVYHEILDDPKMGRMPDHLWRRTIELFLVAGEEDAEGLLPKLCDMAYRLRVTDDELTKDLDELEKLGVIHKEEAGWVVTRFAERQAPVSDAERMRRYRERQRKDDYYGDDDDTPTVTNTVTKRSQIRIDKNRVDEMSEDETLLDVFCNVTGIVKPFNTGTFAKWMNEISEWEKLDVTPKTIQDAYNTAMEKNYTIARPGGLTSFIRGERARANHKKGGSDPYPDFGIVYDENGVAYNAKGEVVNV